MAVEILGSVESMSPLVDSLIEVGLLPHDNSKSGTNAIMIFFIFCLLFYLFVKHQAILNKELATDDNEDHNARDNR